MKTFTTCAEKKAKQILNLLQGYTKGIRITAILILLLMGVGNAWAYNFYSPHIYFNNADLNWNPAMLFVGHDSYSQGYNQTKNPIDNTKLVYFHPTASWSDQKYFTIGNSQNWGAESNGFYSRVNYLTHIGIQSNYDFNSNNTYYVTGSVSSSISVSYKSNDTNEGYKSIPTYDAKQAAKVRDINSGTYTNISGTFPATLKIKGTYLSGWQASTRSEISGTKYTDSNKYGTVVTGLVTHSYSNLSDDYQFDGWGTSTTPSSTNSTYEYNISAATTVYAFFTKKYAVTFGTSGNGSITATADGNNITSGTKVVGGSKIVFTATPATGYQIEGWYSDAACTSSLSNGTNTTYTISSLTAATTVYVKFKANTYTVTLDQENGTGGTESVIATYNSAMPSITVPTRTGYTFGGYYTEANGGGTQYYKADGTSAKNWDKTSATTLYAKWTENTYTVTINNDGHGTTSPSGEQTVGQVTSTTITATPSTGYQFHSWTCEGGVVKVSESNTTEQGSITITATATGTVTANFEPIPETKYDVEIIAGANGSVSPSGTQQVGESGIDIEATANDNYQFSQWTTTGGATVVNANNATTTVTATAAGTVTANFTEIMRTITVESSNANHGTVSPSSTTAGVVTPSGDITATPKTGYEFVYWTATTGITLADDNSATTTIKQATADGTVTANFQEIKHTIQIGIAAGQESWGSVSPTSVSVGQHTASDNITATAQTSVGYVFDHWEISDGITIASGDVNSATIQITATQAGSLTAHFRGENRLQEIYLIGTMNNWTTSDADWQFYKLPGESGNTVTLTKTIDKSDYHNDGYKFGINIYQANWNDKYWKNSADNDTKMDAHNCTGWKFATNSNNYKTYIDLNVSGEYTFTLTNSTTYNQQALSITYPDKSFIEGEFATEWDENAYPLTENGDIQSVTIPITSKTDVEFRLVSHGKLFGTSTQILVGANSQTLSTKNMEDNGAVMTIGAYVEGDYTFSYNKSTKILTVEYPSVNQLQVYSADPAHDAVTENWDWDINGNEYTKTLSLNANTNYEFKAVVNSVFYGRTHTITRAESSSTLYDTGGNVTLTTDVAGDYTFTFNSSNKNLTVAYPTAYKLTYESTYVGGTVSATAQSNTLQLPNTEIVFTATAHTGFRFIGWKDGNDLPISTDNPYTHKMVSDITLTTDFVTSNDQVVYLKPTSKWKGDKPTFAVHVWNNGGDATAQDIPMTAIDCSGDYYTATIPAGFHSMVFYRKSTDGTTVWNQTADLVIPTDNNNCYTITSTGTKNPFNAAGGNWGTYTEPKYAVTINAPESGTIKVTIGGVTTTVTSEAKTISNVALNAQMDVLFEPATGYKLGKAIIEIGNNDDANAAGTYTVCGPTEITAYFVTEEDQIVYLRPTDAWLADNARFAAYAFNRYAGTEAAQWIELITEETDYTGAFSGTIPEGFSHVQFVRMPETGDFSFNIDLAQTLNYSIPTDGINNRFILGSQITSGSDEGKYQGSWEANNTPIYGIPGDWQGNADWAAGDYPLMGPDGEVTVNITQTNDTLGFKVYRYPYGTDENSRKWLGNNGTMVRGNSTDWPMTTTGNNCGLGVDIADDYVFNFDIRTKQLTVTYPELPAPNDITASAERVFEESVLTWVAGNGTEANPYQLYIDETARFTVTPLTEVAGLTAYYRFGHYEEQTANSFDFTEINTKDTTLTVIAYYKNAMGSTSDTVTTQTPYIKGLTLPFYLMTDPSGEINIDRVAAGENILVQFRSDAAATVGLYVKIGNGEEQKLTDITSTISTDYTHDVDDNIAPCVLHYIARSTEAVNNRTFEATVDVVIYKNVIIKVHDPDGWVKNAYMWRDYSDAVKTQWPGDPVLQNFGTWRVFSVKYPYYDRFIVNDGKAEGATQTIDYVLPADDTCYELLDPADNGSDKEEDKGKYGLKVADCPKNLLVEDIKDTTIMEGEQIVVMPKIYVGLGYQLSDVTITQLNALNPSSVRADISGTNIVILGYAEGESNVNVTYNLNGTEVQKTFKVIVEKNTNITIQVKVPNFGDGSEYQWTDGSKYGIRYWGTGIDGTDLTMDYAYTDGTYMYAQAQIPIGTDGKINFHFYYESHSNDNAKWRQTTNVPNVETSGCYTLKQGNDYYRHWERTADYCFDDENYAQYQVKVFMPTLGKEYSSNIVTNTTDTLSFFAPGENETGYRAGNVQLYKNKKMIASIPANNFPESNVYTATIAETGDGLDNVSTYSGNFYIRTYGTSYKNVGFNNGKGWNSIKDLTAVEKDSVRFTKFTSREGEFYNHYWVQAMNTGTFDGKDVSACVANEYNDDLAGKLLQDKHTNEYGDIKVGTGKVINVRFGYDPRTNYFGRAILQGSEYDTYLNLHCNNAYRDKDCTKQFPYGNSNVNNKMYDISNWVYQRDIYVPIDNSHPSASLYLEATSPSTERTVTDHLLGYVTNEITGEATTTPIQKTIIGSGTTNGTYLIRVVYDFKTNRLIAAWLPQGTIDVKEDRTLNADVLFVRQENNEVPQIQLAENGKIRSLESLYFAIELLRGDEDSNNRRQEQYWFTLPFDCKVGSISGVHGYMQIWGIQRYRGDLRAQKGWYAETPTFWEWLDTEDVMHAGEGYLLVFDKKNAPFEEIEVDKMDDEGNIIDGQKETISMMRLYFPSMTSGFDMQQQLEDQLTRTYENHTCTLTLHDRYLQDSNWKVIGTTSYNNAGITGYTIDTDPEYEELSDAPSFRYSYEYNWENGFKYTYTPEDGKTATYNSFFGYMVQFAGTITWQPIMSETVPEGIAARRYVPANERTSFTTRLEIANAEGEKQDQTFVALDEKATTTFDQNLDLNKVMNSHKANIYTLSENIPFAGNTLPMEKATVPVGVVTATAGEYTFRMPDGTDGISVFLIDNQTGAQTNMLLDEYTITLDAGTCENRFYLAVDPDRTATSVENIGEEAKGEEAKGVEKFLIDGQLFIRTTDGTFDAKGQRL